MPDERCDVGVLEQVVEQRLGLRRRVCRGRCFVRHKVRRVAERKAPATAALRAAHVHRRASVGVARASTLNAVHCVRVEAAQHIRAGCKSVHLDLRAVRVQREGAVRVIGRAKVADLARRLHLRSGSGGCVERDGEHDDGVAHTRVVVNDAGRGDGGGGGVGTIGRGDGILFVPSHAEAVSIVKSEHGFASSGEAVLTSCGAMRLMHESDPALAIDLCAHPARCARPVASLLLCSVVVAAQRVVLLNSVLLV